jgi:hypothetical protein
MPYAISIPLLKHVMSSAEFGCRRRSRYQRIALSANGRGSG